MMTKKNDSAGVKNAGLLALCRQGQARRAVTAITI
jgi:hypothetical protein